MADPTCAVCTGPVDVTEPHVAIIRHVEEHGRGPQPVVLVHESRAVELRHRGCEAPAPAAAPTDGQAPAGESPAYLALDVWQALGLPADRFHGYYERNGWAETWAVLMSAVRGPGRCGKDTDGEPCVLAPHSELTPCHGASDVGASDPLPWPAAPADDTAAPDAAAPECTTLLNGSDGPTPPDPQLVRNLGLLGDRYGPMGVAIAAAGLTDVRKLRKRLARQPGQDGAMPPNPFAPAIPDPVAPELDVIDGGDITEADDTAARLVAMEECAREALRERDVVNRPGTTASGEEIWEVAGAAALAESILAAARPARDTDEDPT